MRRRRGVRSWRGAPEADRPSAATQSAATLDDRRIEAADGDLRRTLFRVVAALRRRSCPRHPDGRGRRRLAGGGVAALAGGGLVAATALLWFDRRQREVVLLTVRGVSPAGMALKAVSS